MRSGIEIVRLTALLSVFALFSVVRADEAEKTDVIELGSKWYPEGGKSAPVSVEPVDVEYDGKVYKGARLTCVKRKSYNKIYLRVRFDATVYNTIQFKYRIKAPEGARDNMGFVLVDNQGGGWCTSNVGKFSKKEKDGWLQFQWDAVNQPQVDHGITLSKVMRIGLTYGFNSIPEGKSTEITVFDVKLIKGLHVDTGNPKFFKQWREYITTTKPDYSDSSKYLLPPEKGRLKTPLRLYRDGKPLGEIVLPRTVDPITENAAKELQRWLGEIGGGKIAIRKKASTLDNVKIYLGDSGGHSKDLAVLKGTDGFAVRSKGKNIYIFGAEPKGTMNGVFAFLENNTDIIWARPFSEFGTVYSKNPNLSIAWGDAVERPGSHYRGWQPNVGGGRDFWAWADHNRNNYYVSIPAHASKWGDFIQFGGGHNLQTCIPKDDPKYYPVIKGKKPKKLNIWHHQICMSVPGLVKTYAANVIAKIKKRAPKGIDAINIKIEDNWGVCECQKCTAPIKLPNGKLITIKSSNFRSTQFYNFLNKVTAEVNKVYPKLKVQTYGYFFTREAPAIPLNPNIYVIFCPYVRKDYRTPLCSPINDYWWKTISNWHTKTKNLIIREYFGIFNGGRPVADVIAFDTRNYLKINVENFTSEINPDFKALHWDGAVRGDMDAWDFNMMEYWIINRIYWNPNLKVEQLRKYFIRRTFREAAPAMEKFFGTIWEQWYKSVHASGFLGGPSLLSATVVQPKLESEMRGYLAKAAEEVRHPVSRILVHRVATRFDAWMKLANAGKRQIGNHEAKIAKLTYGWIAEGRDASTRATTVYLNGKPTDLIRFTFTQRGSSRHVIRHRRVDVLKLADTPVLSFTMIPSKRTTSKKLPFPKFFVQNADSKRVPAPDSAYTIDASGVLSFKWDISGTGSNLNKTRQLIFKYDYGKLKKGEKAVFYITKMSLDKSSSKK